MEGESRAPGFDAEELDADSDPPIGKRSLFEVTDVVFVESDPIVADQDVAAGVGMGRVHIVLKGRGEEPRAIDGQPKKEEDGKRRPDALSKRTKHSD